MDAFDSHLVLSFVGETRLLAISEEDVLDEACIAGFDADSQTLLAATTLHDHLLQVGGWVDMCVCVGGYGSCVCYWEGEGPRVVPVHFGTGCDEEMHGTHPPPPPPQRHNCRCTAHAHVSRHCRRRLLLLLLRSPQRFEL